MIVIFEFGYFLKKLHCFVDFLKCFIQIQELLTVFSSNLQPIRKYSESCVKRTGAYRTVF